MAKAKAQANEKQLKVTLVRSPIGYEKSQGETARALGLRKMHASVIVKDIPAVRGMIAKITHLLAVEEVG
ncbi:MAG: 50S ribosomal protein L30 [Anaerolineae bacterium]|nr:50S ribosomal protein L30 [Anaerolineae bacterium]NUQ03602.1 50S ribosomal protein L30 [Anaerolineae bacterium]